MKTFVRITLALAGAAALGYGHPSASGQDAPAKQGAFSDYRSERPGVIHKITIADLPAPLATPAVSNPPTTVRRREAMMPQTLPGYGVSIYAEGLSGGRQIRTAPNGDLFITEPRPGRVKVFRGIGPDGKAQTTEIFATGLDRPFGVAFYPPGPNPTHVYVANTGSIVRFPYKVGDLKASGPQEVVVAEGAFASAGGHWTRDVVFSRDGKKMYVGIGSASNVADPDTTPAEKDRAAVLEFNADGTGRRVYASGIRNPVGLTLHPRTGQVWVTCNERDDLGDNLVPDYVTHVQAGGFYGWPWFYMGGNQDPRHAGKHPELKDKVLTPDVLFQPHSAPLGLLFYTGTQFPTEHRDSIFVASHGSWNKAQRTGYKLIRVPLKDGVPTGEYEDFMTGFVTPEGYVWGRPVGVAMAGDGSLLVSDDASNIIWRIAYQGRQAEK